MNWLKRGRESSIPNTHPIVLRVISILEIGPPKLTAFVPRWSNGMVKQFREFTPPEQEAAMVFRITQRVKPEFRKSQHAYEFRL